MTRIESSKENPEGYFSRRMHIRNENFRKRWKNTEELNIYREYIPEDVYQKIISGKGGKHRRIMVEL